MIKAGGVSTQIADGYMTCPAGRAADGIASVRPDLARHLEHWDGCLVGKGMQPWREWSCDQLPHGTDEGVGVI
jgi:hypothetical protein